MKDTVTSLESGQGVSVGETLHIPGQHSRAGQSNSRMIPSDTSSMRSYHKYEKMPFLGPPDPSRWPLHKKLFLGGLLFPPLWVIGAFLPVRDYEDNWAELFRLRCQAVVMILFIIGIALVILENAFRH